MSYVKLKILDSSPNSAMAAAKKKVSRAGKSSSAKKGVSAKAALAPVMVRRTTTFGWFRTGLIALALGAVAALMALNPELIEQLKANLLAQMQTETTETSVAQEHSSATKEGILLAYELDGANEKKLVDIFRTVFPNTELQQVLFSSEEGKTWMGKLSPAELPALYFEKSAFESEKLSEVVKDLFSVQGDYYALNVALVNPSGQIRLQGDLHLEGAVRVGKQDVPLTAMIYSDVLCQHCRASERNHQEAFQDLADEGLVQLIYLDLPQTVESTLYSTVLSCAMDQKKSAEDYVLLRQKLFSRANLTKAFAIRELDRLGVNFESQCDEASYRQLFRTRLKEADLDGITGVPAVYIGKTGGNEWYRITGAKDFTEYQAVMDQLMATVNEEPAAQ